MRARVHATATNWTLAKRPDHVATRLVRAEQDHHSHGNLEGGEHGRFRFVMRERQSAATEQLMEPYTTTTHIIHQHSRHRAIIAVVATISIQIRELHQNYFSFEPGSRPNTSRISTLATQLLLNKDVRMSDEHALSKLHASEQLPRSFAQVPQVQRPQG